MSEALALSHSMRPDRPVDGRPEGHDSPPDPARNGMLSRAMAKGLIAHELSSYSRGLPSIGQLKELPGAYAATAGDLREVASGGSIPHTAVESGALESLDPANALHKVEVPIEKTAPPEFTLEDGRQVRVNMPQPPK